MTSRHKSAADEASAHLDAAVTALAGAYDHPHHADRLTAIGQHVATLKGWIETMPDFEDSRADHASRVMDAYRNMRLGPTVPDHDQAMIRQELERAGI